MQVKIEKTDFGDIVCSRPFRAGVEDSASGNFNSDRWFTSPDTRGDAARDGVQSTYYYELGWQFGRATKIGKITVTRKDDAGLAAIVDIYEKLEAEGIVI